MYSKHVFKCIGAACSCQLTGELSDPTDVLMRQATGSRAQVTAAQTWTKTAINSGNKSSLLIAPPCPGLLVSP